MAGNDTAPPLTFPGLGATQQSVIWHQTGSGKTASMPALLKRIVRDLKSTQAVIRTATTLSYDLAPDMLILPCPDNPYAIVECKSSTRIITGILSRWTAEVTPSPANRPNLKEMLRSYEQPLRKPDHATYCGGSGNAEAVAELDTRFLTDRSGVPFDNFAAASLEPSRVSITPEMMFTYLTAARLIRVTYDLEQLTGLRDGLLRRIGGIHAAICLMLVLFIAALAHRPSVTSFVLVLVATSRRYGRRSEPDDHPLPAHRSLSGIGGEPFVRR